MFIARDQGKVSPRRGDMFIDRIKNSDDVVGLRPCAGITSHPSGVELFGIASCYTHATPDGVKPIRFFKEPLEIGHQLTAL